MGLDQGREMRPDELIVPWAVDLVVRADVVEEELSPLVVYRCHQEPVEEVRVVVVG
jgi:hypothetical protein